MGKKDNKLTGQVFVLTMDNTEDQDELNRRLRKPGEPDCRGKTMAVREVAFRPRAILISCTDHHRSARFYEEVLGAIRLPGDGYGCQWFRLGLWELSLMPNATEGSAGLLPTHAATMLMLEVDDLVAAHHFCVRAGAEIIEPPNGLHMIIADPDGLEIEVWQADDKDAD